MNHNKNTSWENVHRGYHKSVGTKGSFYHQEVVIPNSLRLLDIKPADHILDLACGQGVLERYLPQPCTYLGLDLSPGLLEQAQRNRRSPKHRFQTQDLSKPFHLKDQTFTKAAIILGLQNLPDPSPLIQSAATHLTPSGLFLIVINHPYFRIPRQTSWHIDTKNKLQGRLVNHYLSPLKIPINMSPSRGSKGKLTWSFHFPLQHYIQCLHRAGLKVSLIEEWTSPKQSQGKFKKMEDHSRQEFPLFMAILSQKVNPS